MSSNWAVPGTADDSNGNADRRIRVVHLVVAKIELEAEEYSSLWLGRRKTQYRAGRGIVSVVI